MKKSILSLTLSAVSFLAHAQSDRGEIIRTHKYKTVHVANPFLKQVNIGTGYVSNLFTNPGLSYQLESPYKTRTKEINKLRLLRYVGLAKRDRYKTVRYDFLVGLKTAVIFPQDHTNVLFEANSSLRRTGNKGWQRELLVGLSYNLNFLKGPVYEKEGDVFVKKALATRGYVMPVLGMGYGKEFKNHSSISLNMAFYMPTRMPMGIGWSSFGITYKSAIK